MNAALVRCPDCGQLAKDINTSKCGECALLGQVEQRALPARVRSTTRAERKGTHVSSVPGVPTRSTNKVSGGGAQGGESRPPVGKRCDKADKGLLTTNLPRLPRLVGRIP